MVAVARAGKAAVGEGVAVANVAAVGAEEEEEDEIGGAATVAGGGPKILMEGEVVGEGAAGAVRTAGVADSDRRRIKNLARRNHRTVQRGTAVQPLPTCLLKSSAQLKAFPTTLSPMEGW